MVDPADDFGRRFNSPSTGRHVHTSLCVDVVIVDGRMAVIGGDGRSLK